MAGATTIQVSPKLKKKLDRRKFVDAESYESVIWGLLEDTLELDRETKESIARAEADFAAGRAKTLEQAKKSWGYDLFSHVLGRSHKAARKN